jgi:hypothetical protein
LAAFDSLIPNTTPGSTVFQGALIHYEDPSVVKSSVNGLQPTLTTNTSNLLNMNPVRQPNNFNTATLLPGSSWSDPYSLLTLKTESADATGLVLSATYDTPCAALVPSFTGMVPASRSEYFITVTGSSNCSWTASTASPWITLDGATSGNGTGSVKFSVAENPDLQRTGFITVQRQSLVIQQRGTDISVLGVSPVPGSGLSQTFTVDFAAPDPDTLVTLDPFELEFAPFIGPHGMGSPTYCHILGSLKRTEPSHFRSRTTKLVKYFPMLHSRCLDRQPPLKIVIVPSRLLGPR